MQSLIKLAQHHNFHNPHSLIDLNVCNSIEELIFALWSREVDVSTLGFGFFHDKILRDKMIVDYDSCGRPITDLNKNKVYLTYLHSDKIASFLAYSLSLPKLAKLAECHNNLDSFNEIRLCLQKRSIKNLSDLRAMFKNREFSRIDLCCLLWDSENYHLYRPDISVDDFLEVECGINYEHSR